MPRPAASVDVLGSTAVKKMVCVSLILGFLFVDFLFFHDILKPGESTSFAQYLTGVLSVPAVLLAAHELFQAKARGRRI